ncbi:MAG: hypothetical protein Q8R36_00675 [bacterium]|nr:hypothetical protein [bacterium]
MEKINYHIDPVRNSAEEREKDSVHTRIRLWLSGVRKIKVWVLISNGVDPVRNSARFIKTRI